MDRYAKLVIVAILVACGHGARAAYSNLPPPPGWGGGPGAWTFNNSVMGDLLNRPFIPWENGRTTAQVTANVGGRSVAMSAGIRASSRAGASVFRNIAGRHPAGIALMVAVPAIADWLSSSGVRWNDEEERWEYEQPVGIDPTKPHLYWLGPGNMWHETALGACQASYGTAQGNGYSDSAPHTAIVSGTSASCMGTRTYSTPGWSSTTVQRGGVSGGWFCPSTMQPSAAPPATCNAPPAEDEWLPGEVEPDIIPRLKPLPDAVPNTAPSPGLPLPVDLPSLNPDGSGAPQTRRYPSGDPVLVPGSDPQQWRQPYIDVVPRPTMRDPWQVDMQPGETTQDNPGPNPDPTDRPTDDPGTGVPRDPTSGEDQRQLCDVYPDIVACQKLGTIDAEPLPEQIIPVAISPAGGTGGGGSCPAPRSVTIAGKTYTFGFDMICQVASGIRPIVIALAWLSAILSFMGLSRRGD